MLYTMQRIIDGAIYEDIDTIFPSLDDALEEIRDGIAHCCHCQPSEIPLPDYEVIDNEAVVYIARNQYYVIRWAEGIEP